MSERGKVSISIYKKKGKGKERRTEMKMH